MRKSVLMLLVGAPLGMVAASYGLRPLVRGGSSRQLNSTEFARAKEDFRAVIQGRYQQPVPDLRRDGMIARAVETPFRGLTIESENASLGQGAYLVRREDRPAVPLLISAPHRGADRLTGPLALKLFVELGASAAAWNSVPRSTADLARLDKHPFTAFAEAFAEAYPQGRIVQLHGYQPSQRRTEAARNSEVVLSSGSEEQGQLLNAIASCVRGMRDAPAVAVFPSDVSELGATNNAQARQLRKANFRNFVHVEMSLRFRQLLLADPDARIQFGKCLEAV